MGLLIGIPGSQQAPALCHGKFSAGAFGWGAGVEEKEFPELKKIKVKKMTGYFLNSGRLFKFKMCGDPHNLGSGLLSF